MFRPKSVIDCHDFDAAHAHDGYRFDRAAWTAAARDEAAAVQLDEHTIFVSGAMPAAGTKVSTGTPPITDLVEVYGYSDLAFANCGATSRP